VSKRILVSEALFRRLCEEGGLEGYRIKLGRWILREEIGEFVGRKGEAEGQVEEEQSKR
jgi:hypothetical protein